MLSLEEYSDIAEKFCYKSIKKFDEDLFATCIELMAMSDKKFSNETEQIKKSMRGKACGFAVKKFTRRKRQIQRIPIRKLKIDEDFIYNDDHSMLEFHDMLDSVKLLKQQEKDILTKFVEGYTNTEISNLYKIDSTTVRNNLKKALNKVKDYV